MMEVSCSALLTCVRCNIGIRMASISLGHNINISLTQARHNSLNSGEEKLLHSVSSLPVMSVMSFHRDKIALNS